MSEKNDTVFIYVLQRISDKAYLYIGSSRNPKRRFGEHKNGNQYSIIREAFSNEDIRFLVITATSERNRKEIESQFWQQFKNAGHPIVNKDPLTVFAPNGPCIFTEEHRHKISIALKGRKKPPESEETRRKKSEASKGRKMPPRTDEYKAKMSASKKGKHLSEEHKRKISESHKGKPFKKRIHTKRRRPATEETKRKISEAKKGKPRNKIKQNP